MSTAWASVQAQNIQEGSDIQQKQIDDPLLERRIADLRRKYESAIRTVNINYQSVYEIPNDIFLTIVDDIGPYRGSADSTGSAELFRIQYLALKNHSQLLEMRGDIDEALNFALKALEMNSDESSLLFRICKLCIKAGDSWTPNALLYLFRDAVNNGGAIPFAITKLIKEIQYLESVRRSWDCYMNIGNDLTGSVLITRGFSSEQKSYVELHASEKDDDESKSNFLQVQVISILSSHPPTSLAIA